MHRGGALASDYGFDTNGNRTAHRIGPASPLRGQSWPCLGALPAGGDSTVSGSYDTQDRMTAYGSCTYEYTRNGELTRRVDSATSSTTEYDYDEFGNLRRVVLPDNRVITYHIDGLNRRVGKSLDGVRQWGLLYANQLEPVAELDADGNVVSSFIYADRPHVPSLMLKGGQTYRIVADHLGSVRLVVDIATGAIAQRMSYDEYGNVVEDTNPGFQPFGYAGGLYDRDTGLVRFGARDYDAIAGRWTAKDPIRFGGGDSNFYNYVAADPVNHVDLTGLAVMVMVGGPTEGNPFGHVALAITGSGVYSFGTGTELGSSVTDYLASQSSYRDTSIYILNSSAEQDSRILSRLRSYEDNLPPVPGPDSDDTCATRTNRALMDADFRDPSNPYSPFFASPLPESTQAIGSFYGSNPIILPRGTIDIPVMFQQFNPSE